MSSRINRVPEGLQKILGSQSLGVNPQELLGDVRPSIELFDLYTFPELEYQRGAGSLTGRGIVSSVTVPQGETWLVKHIAADIAGVTTAATRYSISLRLDGITGMQAGIGLALPLVRGGFTSDAIGDIFSISKTFEKPFYLVGGNRIAAWFDINAAGNNTLNTNVWFSRL